MGKSGEEGFRCENQSWELVLFYIHIERFSHRIYIWFSACVSWCSCSSFFATSYSVCSFQFDDLASVVSIPQKILHYLVVMFSELSNCGEKFLQNWKLHCKMMRSFQSIFKYGDFFFENRYFVTALLRWCCCFSPITTAFLTGWSNCINY